MNKLIKVSFAGIGLVMLCFAFRPANAAVNLIYFTAEGENTQVRVAWQTATELNNAGFFVQRSSQRDSGYTRVNSDIIPAEGTDFTGSSYEYIDSSLVNGTLYWYRLESIDLGQNSQFSDPVNVIVGGTPAPTPTQTRIFQGTQTTTPQQTIAPTITYTVPPTFTTFPTFTQGLDSGIRATPVAASPYPAPGQTPVPPVQSGPPQPGSSASYPPPGTPPPVSNDLPSGATATFAPFPTVTIVFPKPTEIPLPPEFPAMDRFDIKKFLGFWPLGLLLVGWLIIGGWFYYSHRHDE